MAIQDEMYKMIEREINIKLKENQVGIKLNENKVKKVAKMLTSLSTDKGEAESLTNQYMANIKNICKQN